MPKSKADTNIPRTVVAKASFVSNSPRKVRLVADAVRGLGPEEAVAALRLLPHRAARPLLLVFQQALGNAKNNFKLSPADLSVITLAVGEGPRGPKRADVHSHGARFDRGIRRKRMSHITLVLSGGK